MNLGVLFSGGKDSTLALQKAREKEEVRCLISLLSKNKESFMFHTPNIGLTRLQAEALELPLIQIETAGEKEREVEDLKEAVRKAKDQYEIEGIVSGAVESVYQAERVQRVCRDFGLYCFNPLWKKDQKTLLEELVQGRYDVIISGVFAYPLDKSWLGRKIDEITINELISLHEEFGISPSGEGGEIETTVLDCPMFNKRIEVLDFTIVARANSGIYEIRKARLASK